MINSPETTNNTEEYIPHIIVIGSGPVGVRFINELLKRQPNSKITLFGEERVRPYLSLIHI